MISDKEYKRMEFNPVVKKSLTVEYPKLKGILGEGDDRMMRYVLLMYDMNSPLREYYPELDKRKQFAASMAGYDLDKEDVTELFDFKVKGEDGEYTPNEHFINMIMAYLKYQNNWVWSMIVSNSEAFYEFNKRVMMPVDGARDKDILQAINIKTQIMESQDQVYQRLQKYYRELTGDDQEIEEIIKRKRIRPENIDLK